jgi:hypothetical protein
MTLPGAETVNQLQWQNYAHSVPVPIQRPLPNIYDLKGLPDGTISLNGQGSIVANVYP